MQVDSGDVRNQSNDRAGYTAIAPPRFTGGARPPLPTIAPSGGIRHRRRAPARKSEMPPIARGPGDSTTSMSGNNAGIRTRRHATVTSALTTSASATFGADVSAIRVQHA
jgi:hypothetical protein